MRLDSRTRSLAGDRANDKGDPFFTYGGPSLTSTTQSDPWAKLTLRAACPQGAPVREARMAPASRLCMSVIGSAFGPVVLRPAPGLVPPGRTRSSSSFSRRGAS
jgi:hypothetical protein